MNKKVWIGTIIGVLCLCGLVFGILKYMPDKEVEQVKALQQDLIENREKMTDEQRREGFEKMRTAMDNLPEDKRQAVRENMRQGFMNMMQQRMNEYNTMTPEQKVARLDEDIDRMVNMRKEWEKRRKEREANGEGREGRPQRPSGERGNRGGGQAGQGGRAGGGPGGPGGGPGGGRAEGGRGGPGGGGPPWARGGNRDNRRLQMLDKTTPEMRAQFTQYREDLKQRMEERGIEGGFFGRGGGRGR